jgi:hypothetical protein
MRWPTSSWSNPRKPLIPSLQDDRKAADSLRQWRWPAGVTCPRCGSEAVAPRARCDNGRQRVHCGPCAVRWGQPCALGTDWTRALCEERQVRPLAWGLVLGLGPWQLHATAMAAAANIQARTAPRWVTWLEGGLSETSPLAPTRPLEHPVEADAGDQRAGSTGLARAGERHARAPRQRGRPRRGRATAAAGRPPRLGWGHRRATTAQDAPAAPGSLAGLEPVRPATLTPIMAAKVQGGAPCCTDAYPISQCPAAHEAHRPVHQGAGA